MERPSGQYHFVSVVLHELGHGFGISGSMESNGSFGTWGYAGLSRNTGDLRPLHRKRIGTRSPVDCHGVHGTARATDRPGPAGVFWNGSNAVIANGGVKPRLYAPSPFRPGSSYSHLDEGTYPVGNPNSLMTPMLAAREVIDDPGPIARGLLTDEGWTTSSGGNSSSCSYSVSPTAASIGATGGTASISVNPTGSCAWTAVSNTPSMLAITGAASSTGAGTVTYAVWANAGDARTGTMTIAGQTVTVSQGSAPPTPTPTLTNAPFGQVDTPVQNAAGVQGAIGITGWALDDVGVANVKIYRNCLPVDGACQSIGGYSVVYIGDAGVRTGRASRPRGGLPVRPAELPRRVGLPDAHQHAA